MMITITNMDEYPEMKVVRVGGETVGWIYQNLYKPGWVYDSAGLHYKTFHTYAQACSHAATINQCVPKKDNEETTCTH